MNKNKYNFVDDPEPKEPVEDGEDRFIRRAGKVFNIAITIAFCVFVVLFICGVVIRLK